MASLTDAKPIGALAEHRPAWSRFTYASSSATGAALWRGAGFGRSAVRNSRISRSSLIAAVRQMRASAKTSFEKMLAHRLAGAADRVLLAVDATVA
jgi:hypothetical protein